MLPDTPRAHGPESLEGPRSGSRSSRCLLPIALPEVVRSRIRKDGHNHALANSLREAQGRVERRTARRADEDPFRPSEPASRGLGVLRRDEHHLVRPAPIPDPPDERRPEVLHALEAAEPTVRVQPDATPRPVQLPQIASDAG